MSFKKIIIFNLNLKDSNLGAMRNVKVVFKKNIMYLNPVKVVGAILRNGPLAPFKKFMHILANFFHEIAFDRLYLSETSHIVSVDDLDIPDELKKKSVRYRPVNFYSLKRSLKYLSSQMEFESSTFIDFGCGKGRALLIASDYGFKKIIGVELSKTLADQCQNQLEKYFSKSVPSTPLEIVNENAISYKIPQDANVFFFYQPFSSEVYEAVLTNVKNSQLNHARDILVLEITPRRRPLFKSLGFTLIHSIDDKLGDPHTVVDVYKLRVN